jgi:hypothetical protein
LLCTMPSVVEVRWKKAIVLLIGFACGLAACTKFPSFLYVALLMPVMAMRRCYAVVVTTVASFLLFWAIAGQTMSNIPRFVRQSLEVSNGYVSAMGLGRIPLQLPVGLLICGLPLLQLALQTMPPINLDKLGSLGWLATFELLIFRQGIIRSDSAHWYAAFITAGVPVAILLLPLNGSASKVSPTYWIAAYSSFVLEALALMLVYAGGPIATKSMIVLESLRRYPSYPREVAHAREMASSRVQELAAASDADSVDVFPFQLSYAILKELPLRNRPVIQSYSAYTKTLVETNAAFLEGESAPRSIYFASDPLDDRYPTMEDSLAWRSLLTHYAPSSAADGFLLLRRREQPVGYKLTPILERNISPDEKLDVPHVPGALIWAEIQTQKTSAERLIDLLYRNQQMVLRVETSRRSVDFTLLDGTSAGGFLLSPYVHSPASMLELYQVESDRLSAENVRRIQVHAGAVGSLGFGRNVKIRLYALVIGVPAQNVPSWPIQSLGRTVHAERPAGSVEFSPRLDIQGGEVRLVVGSPSAGWIPLKASGKDLRVWYGIEGNHSTCSGDVCFGSCLEAPA